MLDQDIFRATDRKRYIEYVNRMHLKYTGDLQTSAIDWGLYLILWFKRCKNSLCW